MKLSGFISAKQSLQRFVRKGGNEDTEQLHNLGILLKENESNLDQIYRSGQKHLRSGQVACEDLHGMADLLCGYADTAHDDQSQAGASLRLVSDFVHTSEHRRSDLFRELDSKMLINIKRFIKSDIAAAKEQKKKHSRNRQQYEDSKMEEEAAKQNKKTPPERRKELAENVEMLKQVFEESEYETIGVFLDCSKNNEFVVAQAMLDAYESFYSFHSSCLKWLEQRRPAFTQLQTKLQNERDAYEQTRASRASRTPAQQKILLARNALFGTPLKTALQREKERGINCPIPLYLRKMIDWINEYGVKEEGIFRISGNQNQVKSWTEKIDLGEPIDLILAPKSDPHLLGSLIKQYLRELPEPLCTVALYQPLLDFMRGDDEKDPREMKDLLTKLPPANFRLLGEVVSMCANVVAWKTHNKMSVSNMATVMGPNLIHNTAKGVEMSPQALLASCSFDDMKTTSDLFVFWTEHHKDIFDSPQFFIRAVKEQDQNALREIFATESPDPNMIDPTTGHSALNTLLASEKPSTDLIQALVDAGADVNMLGGDSLPPVFRCVGPATEKRAALIHLINLGADATKSFVVNGKSMTLLEVVKAEDPGFATDIQQVLLNAQQRQSEAGPTPEQPTPERKAIQPVEPSRALPPGRASMFSPSLSSEEKEKFKMNRMSTTALPIRTAGLGDQSPLRSLSDATLPPPLPSSDSPPRIASGPQPKLEVGLPPSPSTPSSSSSSSSSTPSLSLFSSPSSPSPSRSPSQLNEGGGHRVELPVPGEVKPVYQQICFDSLLNALGNFVSVSCHNVYREDSPDHMNGALVQVAQSLKNLLTSPGSGFRSFSDPFSDKLQRAIRKAAQGLQDDAKKLIHSVRQVNSEKSDSSQRELGANLRRLLCSVNEFFLTCEKASSEQIVTQTQSLSKCLTEFLSCVKTGTDPKSIKEINNVASLFVVHIDQLVKVRALELSDREIQSKLTRSCSSIASFTSELSRQSLTALSSPVEFRNLEPVGSKVKAIITEIQAIYTLIHLPTPERYFASPGGEALEELLGRSELAIERACSLLEKAGDDEVCGFARKTLPALVPCLFEGRGESGELMVKTLSFVTTMRSVGGKMEEMCSGEGRRREKHKADIFLWALEHHYRLAVLSAACVCMESFGGESIPPFVRLPFVVQQACGCFLQLLSTVINN